MNRTSEQEQELRDELQMQINALNNLLAQKDYTGRKVAFEVAKQFKQKFPETSMPALEEYITQETKADEFRAQISELQEQLKNL